MDERRAIKTLLCSQAKGGASMTPQTTWTNDELARIGGAEELEIALRRVDGALRKPVTIWVVRVGGDLYVRAGNGRAAVWFRAAQAQHEAAFRRAASRKTSPWWSWTPATR